MFSNLSKTLIGMILVYAQGLCNFSYAFCEVKQTIVRRDDIAQFPIKIGLAADSQLTTDREKFNSGMRSKIADEISKVAIRPAFLEYLGDEMLDQLMGRLLRKKVDVILYLGDGANSGCTDEVNKVFSILKKYQKIVPVYFVIGNHDYLAVGNMTREEYRKSACDDKTTTDHRPHVLVFGAHEANMLDDKVGFTMLPLANNEALCKKLLD